LGKILCATRGGEASYRTQDAAIALARERGDELVFLYVVNISFLDMTARAIRPEIVTTELEKMGEFLLLMAQERAKQQGVNVSCVIRHGDLREELKAAAREDDIDLVVFGKPAGASSSFTLEDLQAFITEFEVETGCPAGIL
jgi:nucleotide-binding universal stress UspA family protein